MSSSSSILIQHVSACPRPAVSPGSLHLGGQQQLLQALGRELASPCTIAHVACLWCMFAQVMANKQDLRDAMTVEELSTALSLHSIRNHDWHIQVRTYMVGHVQTISLCLHGRTHMVAGGGGGV